MRKKKETKRVVEEQQAGWNDPTPDSYGFENAINELKLNGYQAEKENGVLMVAVPTPNQEEFEKHFSAITNIIMDSGFSGSWGVRIFTNKTK